MFATWMLGFLTLMATLVWVTVVIDLPQPYVGLVVGLLLLTGVIALVMAWRRYRPRRLPRQGMR